RYRRGAKRGSRRRPTWQAAPPGPPWSLPIPLLPRSSPSPHGRLKGGQRRGARNDAVELAFAVGQMDKHVSFADCETVSEALFPLEPALDVGGHFGEKPSADAL